MEYSILGNTGYRVSRLGYGAMRLPTQGARIDRDKAIPMILRALDMGVNYIDSAAGYNAGDSERVVGEAIRCRRDGLVISTKNPHYNRRDDRAWWANLEGSLRRLDVEYIDLYHFHFLGWESFQKHVAGPGGHLRLMHKARDQGLIKHICYSCHDKPENLIRLAKTGEFSSVTLQYNLIDRSNEECIEVLAKSGLGVVVMGPVGGGRLGAQSKVILKWLPGAASVPEIALRFVLANPHVNVALSGMSEMPQVEENVAVASRRTPLSAAEKRRVRAAIGRYKKLADLYCTGCNYCMPCPYGVQIPANFTALNYLRVYDLSQLARQRYAHMREKGSLCVACGACLSKCPQHIDIIMQLRQTVRTLDEAYGKVVVRFEPIEVLQWRRRGGRTAATLRCRMETHNLSDQPADPAIDLSGMGVPGTTGVSPVARGEGVSPLRIAGVSPAVSSSVASSSFSSSSAISTGVLAPFARHQSELEVELDSIDGGGTLELKPAVAAPLQIVNATPTVSFALAPRLTGRRKRASAGGTLASARGTLAFSRLVSSPVVYATQAPVAGKRAPKTPRSHPLSARFAHDAKGLYLQFDIRGRVGKAPGPTESLQRHSRLVVTLGLERQPGIRRNKSAPRSAELRLAVVGGRFEMVRPELKPEEAKGIVVRSTTGPSGARSAAGSRPNRIDVFLPWDVLQTAPPQLPARLGLGLRMVLHRRAPLAPVVVSWAEKNPGYLLLMK